MEPKEVCAICLATLNVGQGQALFTAECCHTFHFSCIASNVGHGNHICPTCRSTWRNLPSQFTPNLTPPTFTPPTYDYIGTDPTLFADDETLPTPTPAPNTASSSQTPPQNGDMMIVKALPQYPALSNSDQSNSFPVLVGIRAPPLSPEASDRPNDRAPLDLIAVLDVSGSMNGDKIRLLKQAVGFVTDNLGPSDRLSVITFATSARRVTPLRRMTDAGRVDTMNAVNSIQVSGATNIIAGLKKAVEVLEQRREKNPVSSIILLSDGQDNQNGRGPDFLRSLSNLPLCLRANNITSYAPPTDGVPVHSFGFGSDHDATALHAIADGSGGTFSYIESIEIIQDAFARCIGGLLSVVAQQVEIQVASGSPGVEIQSIPSGRYRNSIAAGGLHGVIYIGDVYAEEEKLFLVYLSVPPADDQETLTTKLLEVKCCYKDPLCNQNIMSDIVRVEIRRPLAENFTEEDRRLCLEVDRERNRVSIAQGITEAQAMAERGELGSAQTLLEQRRLTMMQTASAQAGDALCERLEGEVKEIQGRMRSKSEYETGGRAYAFSRSSAHLYQRASTQAVIPQAGLRLQTALTRPAGLRQSMAGPATSSSISAPLEDMDYQTSFMRRMVHKSRELRQMGDQSENSDETSNISNS
ncbi:hypothetical protein SOVF_090240 [Spinacia oleracea]|uniref:E3 ubiquitin-protein ligase WAV3 n=1 Tax=Spinacia oleracea TaxID=3562 RepID=A0A9R0J9I8_SPIOL|nr:E3 ubiquitin-protein ligase WAV3-like [Spinacia oleracea]KNA16318.1 hypothetical protein SOVF_090240 [Spinacia oleracea]